MNGPRVVVVGGGLAGISAALSAADGGADVVLVERRSRLGGMTWSLERNGLWFDNGQHVFLRCCSSYRSFLDRIGSAGDVILQDRLAIPVLKPGSRTSWIRRSGLPAPLHLGPALALYRHLSARERLSAALASTALRKLSPYAPGLDATTFGEWLASHHQSAAAIEALWDLIAIPTLNLPASKASLALAVKVFRTGLFDEAGAGDIGWSAVPLVELHANPGLRALEKAGVEVMLGTRVHALDADGELSVRTSRGVLEADSVIVALPPEVAATLVAPEVLGDVSRLGASPIVNVHLVLDRRVTDMALAAAIGSPVQFVFDRTVSSGLAASIGGGEGQCLAVSLSAADDYIGVGTKRLVALFVEALERLFPAMSRARVRDALVTREPTATFRGVPGAQELRPATLTAVPGLFMAGAWCDTGWPATMEGAVRSGVDAACHALGRPRSTQPAGLASATGGPRGGTVKLVSKPAAASLALTPQNVPASQPDAVPIPVPRGRRIQEVTT